jgi:hypothetical protein
MIVPSARTMLEQIAQISDDLFVVLNDGCLVMRLLADSTWLWLFEDVEGMNAVSMMDGVPYRP